MIKLNLCGNGFFTPPGRYPFRLWAGGQTMAEGVIPRGVSSVSAEVYAEQGTASVHLGIFTAPTTSGGADGELVADRDPDDATVILKSYQTDAVGIGLTDTTLTLDLPTNRAASVYIMRLWVDDLTGQNADTEDRDGDDSTEDEPMIPTGVYVNSIEVA